MLIIVVKIISMLVYPAGFSFLLVVLGLVLSKKGPEKYQSAGRKLMALGCIVFFLFSNSWIAQKIGRSLEWRVPGPEKFEHVDGVIVLGGCLEAQISPRRTVEVASTGDRLLFGGYLLKQGYADWVICSGGALWDKGDVPTEAHSMKEMLMRLGVSEDQIILEPKSRNTLENATKSLPLVVNQEAKSVYLVTSASHMARSLAVFQKQAEIMNLKELEIIPAPCDFYHVHDPSPPPWYFILLSSIVPSAEALNENTKYIHEYYGMIYYKLRGWI